MDNSKSIVVLPFSNISSDPENAYFADGITEEIINALSKIDGLLVTARTSSFAYKNSSLDIREIGQALGVSTALEGSIRKAGNRLRISTQLIRTDNGFQVWSESFDRNLEDIFELQDEISLLIAEKIRENFGHLEIADHLVNRPTQNIEAYTLFLKGRYYQLRWNFDEFDLAIDAYEQCLKLDPEFHQPYFGLLQCYGLMASWGAMDKEEGIAKADEYLRQGLHLKPQCSEAYFALATKALWVDWQPEEALLYLEQALLLNPNDSEAMESATEAHIALGQFEKAQQFIERALLINPISANHHFTKGNIHYLQEDFEAALKCFETSLKIDPSWELSLQLSALCYIHLNRKTDLLKLLKSKPDLAEAELFIPLYEAINEGRSMAGQLEKASKEVYFSWQLWQAIYSENTELAVERLKNGIAQKKGQYLNFLREPLNKALLDQNGWRATFASQFSKDLPRLVVPSSTTSNVSLTEDEQNKYLSRLHKLMQEEEVFRSENLSIRSLSEQIDLHPNKLSRLINDALGVNFNEYINGLRLASFKEKALQKSYAHYSILGLAYDCGFNSKSVFNDFFKKSEGITPSAWLKQHK